MTLTNKDKKLLIYLLSIGIVALVYFFVARPNLDKQQELLDENTKLEMQINHYNTIYAHQEEYIKQIAEAQVAYSETIDKFFGGLNQENTLINIKGIEDATSTWVSRISFQETQIMLGNGAEGEAPAGENEEATEDLTVSSSQLTGMKQELNLDYSCNYSDFKRFVELVQNYDQRLYISSLNAAYSMESNKVEGTLVLSQFALLGTDKEYSAPDLSNIGVGVDNIFSTLRGEPQEAGATGTVETIENPEGEEGEATEGEESSSEDSSGEESSGEENVENDNAGQNEEAQPEPDRRRPQGGGII
ncbi:MAG: hypothetical protein Q4D29_04305 [Lachnospiraceae bacterium]|nr:hypothetical protein [Lachnospiraceae bacterium]